MKKVFLAILLVSTAAFATTPLKHNPKDTLLTINQVNADIQSITVTFDGTVYVAPRFNRSLFIYDLSPTNKSELLTQIDYLSTAELKVTQHQMVCMAIQDPHALREVSIHNKETGEFRLVLSSLHCSVNTRTQPKQVFQRDALNVIKEQLIAITLQEMKL